MAEIKIYGIPPSTFTRTARLACHEAGVDYEFAPIMPSEMATEPARKPRLAA
ncbi:MAG: glutathione S-transferase N-terminal domain-containing protein [Reyranella sp.]